MVLLHTEIEDNDQEELLSEFQDSFSNRLSINQVPKDRIDRLWIDTKRELPSIFDTLMGGYLNETDPQKKTRIFNQFMQYQDQMFQRIREGITTE